MTFKYYQKVLVSKIYNVRIIRKIIEKVGKKKRVILDARTIYTHKLEGILVPIIIASASGSDEVVIGSYTPRFIFR
jgi:tRNA A-37 threonylcarbamoyl transferase component Bud32